MKSEGLYSLTFTLRQAEHCNQGGLFKDKSQRTFASKTVFLFIYLFIYLKIRTMYRGENNRTRSPLLGSPSYKGGFCRTIYRRY